MQKTVTITDMKTTAKMIKNELDSANPDYGLIAMLCENLKNGSVYMLRA